MAMLRADSFLVKNANEYKLGGVREVYDLVWREITMAD
jgi:hypothetical protein